MNLKDLKLKYGDDWKAGSDRVKHVIDILMNCFPQLQITPKDKYAISTEYIEYDDKHIKHDPDIVIKSQNSVICMIEVSGTNNHLVGNGDLWILYGKYFAALERQKTGIITWFYLVYPDHEYTIDLKLLTRYSSNVANHAPKGRDELMIHIPSDAAYGKEQLIEWIGKQCGVEPKIDLTVFWR